MQGTTHVGDLIPQPSTGPGGSWELIGTGDLNGDTFPDLLWFNGGTGKVVQWLMNGSMVRTLGRFTNPVDNAGRRPGALADFGPGPGGPTGVTDILWQDGDLLLESRVCCRLWWMDADGNRIGTAPVRRLPGANLNFLQPFAPR